MEFKFKIGDIVVQDKSEDIYQVVGCVEFNVMYMQNDKPRYCVRKIFNSKLELKIGKASLIHESWLRNITEKKFEKIKDKLKCKEIQEIVLEPDFFFSAFIFKGTPCLYCKK